jgi:type II secretory pathway component PulJ
MIVSKKIQAFTLSEMVVVLILTSILVGIAFSVLSLVQKHMANIQNNFSNNTELNKVEQSLWVDFNRYSKIEYNAFDDKITLSNPVDSTAYKFHKEFIVKNSDTFNISLSKKIFYFNGISITSGDIDALKLETSKAFQKQKLFVYKKNDATRFVN